MRILVVQESDWLEKGPHQSHHLMERLSAKGHEVRVIDFEILWKNHGKQSIISKRTIYRDVHKAIPDGRVTVVRPAIIRLPILDYLSLLVTHRKEIKRQLKEFRPDVIVGFGILNANIAMRLARRDGVPFVYYIIDELHRLVPQKMFRGVARRIETRNMRGSNLVLSINEALREYTVTMGAPRNRTSVIKAGIDLGKFNPKMDTGVMRNRLGINDGHLVLFFMGWLYEFSGLRELAEEMRRDSKSYAQIRLLIVGKGDLWEYLQQMKKEVLGDRIILLDWQPYDEIAGLIAASDICILPAHKNEIMQNIVPIKMYEYMAMAKPIIATRLFGLTTEFGDGNGVMYIDSPEQTLELASGMKQSDIIRQGEAARRYVKDMDWMKITEEFENVINRLIDDNQNNP